MARTFLVSNVQTKVSAVLSEMACKAERIELAVAYVSTSEPLRTWLKSGKSVRLLVALVPPTDAKVLRSLVNSFPRNLETKYYSGRFHSKLFLFFQGDGATAAQVGSSNLTAGGLHNNLETNVIVREPKELKQLADHFRTAWKEAAVLQPDDLNRYERYCEESTADRAVLNTKEEEFEQTVVLPRLKAARDSPTARKEARDYTKFWNAVDGVVDAVREVSTKEWPAIRAYLTVDLFWHWLVREDWDADGIRKHLKADPEFRKAQLPVLFVRYARWDKSGSNAVKETQETSAFLQSVLARGKLHKLDKDGARKVYECLHAGYSRTKRFKTANLGADRFVTANRLADIVAAFDHLLWSEGNVENRIDALLHGGTHHLVEFGSSNIQELLGWVRPEMPIRNNKADRALEEILGIDFRG